MDPVDRVLVCPPEESVTRQEFYHDSLVSTILARAGYPQPVPFVAAEIDYDLDLLGAYAAAQAAAEAFASLPPAAQRFGSFRRLVEALAAGSVTLGGLGFGSSAAEPGAAPASEAPLGSPPAVSS